MIYEHCHRCHAALRKYEDGELIYCSHCGAPQVELSEELQAQLEELAGDGAAAPTAAASAPQLQAGSSAWAGAIRYAGLAVAVAAGLATLSVVVPAVGAFTFLWILASPVVVVGVFHAKHPMARITAGFGARVGLVTGLGISVVMLASNAITELLTRRAGRPDQLTAVLAELKQKPDALQNADVMHFIDKINTIPEYRAGWLLCMLGVLVGLLLVATTAAGAFAGYTRSRQRS